MDNSQEIYMDLLLYFQTKYALLDEQDIGLVEQYAFEVSHEEIKNM